MLLKCSLIVILFVGTFCKYIEIKGIKNIRNLHPEHNLFNNNKAKTQKFFYRQNDVKLDLNDKDKHTDYEIDNEYIGNCLFKIDQASESYLYNLYKLPTVSSDGIEFNFCKNSNTCENKSAMIVSNKCDAYSGSSSQYKTASYIQSENALEFIFPLGEICTNIKTTDKEKAFYSTRVLLKCDEKGDYNKLEVQSVTPLSNKDCIVEAILKTKNVCSDEKYESWIKTIQMSKGLLGGILLTFGFLYSFLGRKFDILFIFVLVFTFTIIAFSLYVLPYFEVPIKCKFLIEIFLYYQYFCRFHLALHYQLFFF